jgi:hypothetical protein
MKKKKMIGSSTLFEATPPPRIYRYDVPLAEIIHSKNMSERSYPHEESHLQGSLRSSYTLPRERVVNLGRRLNKKL